MTTHILDTTSTTTTTRHDININDFLVKKLQVEVEFGGVIFAVRGYICALCGYQTPYRSTFGRRGIGLEDESIQIWRQLVSETMGITTYRQTPSTLLDQHAHHAWRI